MKKLIWVFSLCFGLMVVGCATHQVTTEEDKIDPVEMYPTIYVIDVNENDKLDDTDPVDHFELNTTGQKGSVELVLCTPEDDHTAVESKDFKQVRPGFYSFTPAESTDLNRVHGFFKDPESGKYSALGTRPRRHWHQTGTTLNKKDDPSSPVICFMGLLREKDLRDAHREHTNAPERLPEKDGCGHPTIVLLKELKPVSVEPMKKEEKKGGGKSSNYND